MQEYPVYRPEKYSGLGLLLSRSRNQQPQREKYAYSSSIPMTTSVQNTSFPITIEGNRSRSRSPVAVSAPPAGISRIEQRIREDLIKGESRIEYVPVQKKVVDYVDEPRYSIVPKKKTITDYREIVKVDIVPREVVMTDYYAVEHIRHYIPQIIPEHYTDYVPVERKNIKYEYIPVERQILHYPERSHEDETSRYLGIREQRGPKTYENLRDSDVEYWEKEYGYVRGQSISTLNQKIRSKIEREKQLYFKQFQSKTTMDKSLYESAYQKP